LKVTITFDIPGLLERVLVAPVLVYRFLRFGYAFRKIPLTQNKFAMVDPADYAYLSQYNWQAHKGDRTFYAKRCSRRSAGAKRITIFMHKEVMRRALAGYRKEPRAPGLGPRPPKLVVDHVNHNGLDNRRANLRLATVAQNAVNRRKRRGRCKYRGVRRGKGKETWRASIGVNGKRHYLGTFESVTAAAEAYDTAAKRLHGPFASLNFPKHQ